ncbi:MAG: hypothetical protein KJ579_11540, partial [Verrucomicrobia bacterium]|nr:hypothetical protein [Verrucomicrobiota bacterium]
MGRPAARSGAGGDDSAEDARPVRGASAGRGAPHLPDRGGNARARRGRGCDPPSDPRLQGELCVRSGPARLLVGRSQFAVDHDGPSALGADGVVGRARDAQVSRPGSLGVGLALSRPPGHHAEANRAAGFCIFNNIAIAAEALIKEGVRRVLIYD